MADSSGVSLARAFLEALDSADGARLQEICSEDVTLDWPGEPRAIGMEALRGRLARARNEGEGEIADVALFAGEGHGRAAAEFTWRGRDGEGRGRSSAGAAFFDIDDGRISRATFYRGG